jgi:predicted house-cleaning noncanonical NTP pyrophosphatase (MazG superfamily)
MRQGCFLKSIIILTILVAAIMYIVQYKPDIFLSKGNKALTYLIIDNWDKEFAYVKDSPQKSELKNSIKDFIDKHDFKDSKDENSLDSIFELVDKAIEDSTISEDELNSIKLKLKTEVENERSE